MPGIAVVSNIKSYNTSLILANQIIKVVKRRRSDLTSLCLNAFTMNSPVLVGGDFQV